MEKREQLARIIEAYGMEAQIDMALEEMSELAKALLKHRRAVKSGKKFDISLITDEIADVEIMCIQLEIIFKNAHEVEEQINFKINRQIVRMEESKCDQ